jgi:hypothetical protein
MTKEEREEAIKELKEYEDGVDLEYATPFDKAILHAIKALEQGFILDKARAEIESTMKYQYAIGDNQYAEGFEKSLEILDKYKSEDKELTINNDLEPEEEYEQE